MYYIIVLSLGTVSRVAIPHSSLAFERKVCWLTTFLRSASYGTIFTVALSNHAEVNNAACACIGIRLVISCDISSSLIGLKSDRASRRLLLLFALKLL